MHADVAGICKEASFSADGAGKYRQSETAFTVSIDHVSTTTGISAAERSITAMKCVSDDAKPEDFRRPGHMFPLLAKKNGVLEETDTQRQQSICAGSQD